MVHFLICLSALLFSTASYSSDADDKEMLATKLVATLNYEALYEAGVKECAKPSTASADAAWIYKTNPDAFGGVTPKSAYWPEIEAIYQRYRNSVCTYLTREEYLQYFSRRFALEMSAEELKSAINFLSSPTGQKYQKAHLRITETAQSYALEKARIRNQVAAEDVYKALDIVAAKYKKDPK